MHALQMHNDFFEHLRMIHSSNLKRTLILKFCYKTIVSRCTEFHGSMCMPHIHVYIGSLLICDGICVLSNRSVMKFLIPEP